MSKNRIIVLFILAFFSVAAIIVFQKLTFSSFKSDDAISSTVFEFDSSLTNQTDYTLIVNGKNITDKCRVMYNKAEHKIGLPILAISYAMGAEVEGDITKLVKIKFMDESYVLDVTKEMLTIDGQTLNILQCYDSYSASLKDLICSRTEKDYIVESSLLEHFLYLRKSELVIDWEKNIITIREKEITKPKLIVNGKSISSVYLRINERKKYVELPIIQICEELGAQIKWKDDVALISFAENVYELNISDLTLYQLGSNFNLLDTPVGGTVWTYFKSSDNELIVDSLTLSMFFYKINVSSTVDFESDTVFITNNNSY